MSYDAANQYARNQAGAISAAVGFLTFQAMVPPSDDWKEQRPTIRAECARWSEAILWATLAMIYACFHRSAGKRDFSRSLP